MPGRRIKVNRPISPILKLELVAMATSLERSKKQVRSSIYDLPTIWWKFSENWSSESWDNLSEMFVLKKEMRSCTPLPFLNSRVAGPKFTKFTHYVARSSQMNFLKSEWRYSTPFWNAKATNKGKYRQISPSLPFKIGCHGNVPWTVEKEGQIFYLSY